MGSLFILFSFTVFQLRNNYNDLLVSECYSQFKGVNENRWTAAWPLHWENNRSWHIKLGGRCWLRVSSSTKQWEKDFGNYRSASSLNVCGILTSSYSEVTPSESLTAVCEPVGGTSVHAPSQEGNYCCFMSVLCCNKFSHGCC